MCVVVVSFRVCIDGREMYYCFDVGLCCKMCDVFGVFVLYGVEFVFFDLVEDFNVVYYCICVRYCLCY